MQIFHLTEAVVQQLVQHIKMLLKRHMDSERNFRRITPTKNSAVAKIKVGFQIILTRNQYSRKCYVSNYYILGCHMSVCVLCPRQQTSNAQLWSPPVEWMVKLLSCYFRGWACSCVRDTVSKCSNEDIHVSGITIIQGINMAPGNDAAPRCLTVSPFQILFGNV